MIGHRPPYGRPWIKFSNLHAFRGSQLRIVGGGRDLLRRTLGFGYGACWKAPPILIIDVIMVNMCVSMRFFGAPLTVRRSRDFVTFQLSANDALICPCLELRRSSRKLGGVSDVAALSLSS